MTRFCLSVQETMEIENTERKLNILSEIRLHFIHLSVHTPRQRQIISIYLWVKLS